MSASDRPQEVADIVDALGDTPTANEVYQATDKYDTDYIAAAAYAQAKAGGGGGGPAPTTREEWGGNGVSIAANDFGWLTWDTSSGPDVVLDATLPAHPVVITAGVYVVSVVVNCEGDPQSYFDVGLYLDRQGFNASQTARVHTPPVPDASAGVANSVVIAFSWYIPEGGAVEVGVEYFTTGETAASCSLFAHIQRIS